MKTKRLRRLFAAAAAAVMIMSLAAGCSSGSSDKEKETVTVYMWSAVLYDNYAPYIKEQLPDVDIEFIVGNNDLDYYRFLEENGELPDIITCRRFSLYDAQPLKDSLLDLSATDAAGAVYDAYIGSFTNSDGSVNWLPLCGEADGLVGNKALFDKYDIPIPTDYDSLIDAFKEFEKHGIRGFEADFVYDYTCMEILQGLSISELYTPEGREWRSRYEDPSDTDMTGLDDEIWPEAFERMEDFIEDAGIRAEDCELGYDEVMNRFMEGKVAVIRSGGTNTVAMNDMGIEAVFLPYYCDDGEEWILTYPAFQVAVNREAEEDDSKYEAVMKVLDTMVSDGAQKALSGGMDVLSYSRSVNLEMSPSLDNLKPFIDENRMYIRIASNDFFAASLDVVQRMMKGELDAKAAYREFDRQLRESSPDGEETVLSLDRTYSNIFSSDGGRESSSAMANSLRECYGSDVVVAPANSFTETVIRADYSQKRAAGMIMPNSLEAFNAKMTGAQLKEYLRYSVEGIEGGFNPFSRGTLPAVSGIYIEVEQTEDGFVLTGVQKDGRELEDDEVLNVTCLNTALQMEPYMDALGIEFTMQGMRVQDKWLEYVMNGGTVAEPDKYITLK